MEKREQLREQIRNLVIEYYRENRASQPFAPGETRVHYAGRVYDEREMTAAVEACLDFWLTAGANAAELEGRLASTAGVSRALLANSGSSANLLAVSALCSHNLERPLVPGDEVIAPAMGFPTSIAPIVQNGLVPVFVDCELGTYNLDPEQLEPALSGRTRALFFAHTLGNPVDMDRVVAFAEAHDLFIIEDTCDALGSTYDGRMLGSFGDLATLSFYPAHHITTGEGGAVLSSKPELARIVQSLRDWGRACHCAHDSPPEGACGRRFGWKIPGVDVPYDHRYLYSEIGYNLRMTDIQAAIGLAQLEKLPDFVAARRHNFGRLYEGLKPYEEFLGLPIWSKRSDPAWFAFPISVRAGAPFGRQDLTDWLEGRGIETRFLFAGNITRQPGYRHIEHRAVGDLPNSDFVMRSTFFIGVYPGLDDARLSYMQEAFESFFRSFHS
jgi:CDP-6-deoxy-D-xylo-4-hexulose-3-dehydrase